MGFWREMLNGLYEVARDEVFSVSIGNDEYVHGM